MNIVALIEEKLAEAEKELVLHRQCMKRFSYQYGVTVGRLDAIKELLDEIKEEVRA